MGKPPRSVLTLRMTVRLRPRGQVYGYQVNKSVTKGMVQRSQSYQVYNEVYHTSPKQQEVRKELPYNVKTRLDYQSNSKFKFPFQ